MCAEKEKRGEMRIKSRPCEVKRNSENRNFDARTRKTSFTPRKEESSNIN
jgi:hypothetical protein